MKLRSGPRGQTATPETKAKRPASGRATPSKKARPVSGRYTEPIPRTVRRSPRWYPYMLLGLLLGGIVVIILNYVGALPNSPSNWYTLGALGAIVAAALAATTYH